MTGKSLQVLCSSGQCEAFCCDVKVCSALQFKLCMVCADIFSSWHLLLPSLMSMMSLIGYNLLQLGQVQNCHGQSFMSFLRCAISLCVSSKSGKQMWREQVLLHVMLCKSSVQKESLAQSPACAAAHIRAQWQRVSFVLFLPLQDQKKFKHLSTVKAHYFLPES